MQQWRDRLLYRIALSSASPTAKKESFKQYKQKVEAEVSQEVR
jgi:hypothetical protein